MVFLTNKCTLISNSVTNSYISIFFYHLFTFNLLNQYNFVDCFRDFNNILMLLR